VSPSTAEAALDRVPSRTETGPRRAVFTDRDGTINPDLHYISRAERIELYPTVGRGIRWLRARGFAVVCVTNQSGVERGLYTAEDVDRIHRRVNELLAAEGARIDAFYYCPHRPERGCDCRKPNTELFVRAAREHRIDLGSSAIIGDHALDVEVGDRLGLLTALVPERGLESVIEDELDRRRAVPDVRAPTFEGAVARILSRG
jgi:histidinol-phosphate phosphatase family protein